MHFSRLNTAFLLAILILPSVLSTTVPAAVEVPAYDGQCGWCLLSNSTYVYCSANNKCYNKAPTGGVCLQQVNDLLSNGCGTDLCTNTYNILSEANRVAAYDATNSVANPPPAYASGMGLTFTKIITPNNRCSITFNCPTTVDSCWLNISNTAQDNMVAYVLYNSTATTELDIQQEINTYGVIGFRKGSISLMFVSLDYTNPQTLNINYIGSTMLIASGTIIIAIISLIL